MSTLTAQEILNERVRQGKIEGQRLIAKVKEHHPTLVKGSLLSIEGYPNPCRVAYFRPILAVSGDRARVVVNMTITKEDGSFIGKNINLELNSFEVV